MGQTSIRQESASDKLSQRADLGVSRYIEPGDIDKLMVVLRVVRCLKDLSTPPGGDVSVESLLNRLTQLHKEHLFVAELIDNICAEQRE